VKKSSLMALIATMSVATSALALSIGDKAPKTDVKMKNVDGQELSIANAAGPKGTLVIFSCNHCPFVKAWESRITEIGNTYRDKGVGVIAINSNDPSAYPEDSYEQMQKRAKDRGFKFAYVVDATSEVAQAFGASHTPEAFLFDKDGKLIYHGAIDDNSKDANQVAAPYLKDALNALLAGSQIATKETKSIGCGIKFRGKA
jgi:peroxiredoxin